MADREVIVTDGGGTGSGLVIGLILGALVILALLYFTGTFGKMFGGRDTNIDVNIQQPSTPRAPGAILPIR
jgi:hypothetical protein